MNETMTKPRTRVTWSVEDRAAWLELFTKSGQTAAEFCRDNDLPQATLSFWLRQSQEVPVEPGELVEVALPVPVTAADRAAGTVTVQLPSGARLEVPVGTDTAWFTGLLQSLVSARA